MKLKEGEHYHLAEKSDLLDGDLVTRSVLRLDKRFDDVLILTSDKVGEFLSRRRHLFQICDYMNERIRVRRPDGCRLKEFEFIESTACLFEQVPNHAHTVVRLLNVETQNKESED